MEPIDITDEIPFDIPNNWNWIRICNCADIYTGNSISETVKNTKYMGIKEGYNYIGTKDVNFDNTINYDNGVKIPFNEPKFRNAYKDNTLICVEGGSAGRKVAKLSEDVCFGNKLATINSWIINPEYIYLVFQSSIIQNFFKNNMTGIIGGVSINKLKTFLIPIPPFREQKRIVSKYQLFISLINKYDNEYCKIEKLNANYKDELRKSILQYAIQGKLVKQDPNDESAEVLINKILDEKRELIKTKHIKKENLSVIYKDSTDNQFYEKFDDGKIVNITEEIPFDIPDSWRWTRLNNIVSILGDGLHGTPTFSEKGEYYFINGNNLNNGSIIIKPDTKKVDVNEYNKYKKELNNNTMFISINGTVGNIAFYNNEQIILGKSACFFNLINEYLKKYLFYFFKTDYFIKYALINATGTTIRNVSLKVMRNTLIPIPSLVEQERIVKKLNHITNIIETAE